MKKVLTRAALLAALILSPLAAHAAEDHAQHPGTEKSAAQKTTPPAMEKHAEKKKIRLSKEEYKACHEEARAMKDGKEVSKENEKSAFKSCVKAKKAAMKKEMPATKEHGEHQ